MELGVDGAQQTGRDLTTVYRLPPSSNFIKSSSQLRFDAREMKLSPFTDTYRTVNIFSDFNSIRLIIGKRFPRP